MKRIVLYLISSCFAVITYGQGFYELSFKTIAGDNVSLNTYAGKKVLFFIVPLTTSDPVFSQLQSFKNRYLDSIKIVGVISIDDGYQPANTASIQAMYNNMGIVLTEGMYTKKAAGANQSLLMKWLTDKTKNTHFDMDARGIGHKFFVSPGGRLFAVMPPQTSLQAPIINQIVHSTGQ